jgi:hypothetical protein
LSRRERKGIAFITFIVQKSDQINCEKAKQSEKLREDETALV